MQLLGLGLAGLAHLGAATKLHDVGGIDLEAADRLVGTDQLHDIRIGSLHAGQAQQQRGKADGQVLDQGVLAHVGTLRARVQREMFMVEGLYLIITVRRG